MSKLIAATAGLALRCVRWVYQGHQAYVRFVCDHPLMLVLVGIFYFILGAVLTFVSALFGFVIQDLGSQGTDAVGAQIGMALGFMVSLVVLALHYLYLTVYSFVIAVPGRLGTPVLRAVQLVVVMILLFAGIHYYVALFTNGVAYHGLPQPDRYHYYGFSWFDRLIYLPPVDVVIDCIYFSAVTMATLGYGDIYPVTSIAKLATIAEVMTSFVLIVVVLARAIGREADDH